MWSAVIANAAPTLLAIIGGLTWWRSRRRETTEVTSLSQEMWFKEFQRLEDRAVAAEARSDEATDRADALDAALREAHRKIDDLERRLDEMARHQAEQDAITERQEITIEVLTERLGQRHDDPPNGWTTTEVDRRVAERSTSDR